MCFDSDSSPPIAPLRGGAVAYADLTLSAEDGNELAAFSASGDGNVGVVILPDVRGLYRFYEELALRFAERGHDAVAIDYFGRTAGLGKRDDDFDFWPHVEQTTYEGVLGDTAAAIAHLRREDPTRQIVTIGFCFGGSNSWYQASNGLGLSGAIGFYGHPDRKGRPIGAESLMDRVDQIDCPILGLMGGADEGIPQELALRFGDALEAAGVDADIVVYPGAPHSFFDRKYEEFAAESADAWDRVMRFIEKVTTGS
jgi:carboxymethylenebutenolidase